jgi:hypothetical protein
MTEAEANYWDDYYTKNPPKVDPAKKGGIVLLLRKYEKGGSLPLATARASAVFRYPLCGGK